MASMNSSESSNEASNDTSNETRHQEKTSRLTRKILRAYVLQGIYISIAALLSVFFAKVVLEETLIKEAILQEADYFWSSYETNPDFALPDTLNLTGHFDATKLPAAVHDALPLADGFHEFEDLDLVIYTSRHAGKPLYLLYYREQVDSLAMYYGLFPLAVILIFLYSIVWFSYRFSHRIVSPVIWLAQQVNKIDLNARNIKQIDIDNLPYSAEEDVVLLAKSIHQLGKRVDEFVERERNFTRDASHELRSPLTVIRIATDMLQTEQSLAEPARRSLDKIRRASDDMEDLTDAFLLLARESDDALSMDKVQVNDLLEEEIQLAENASCKKNLPITLVNDAQLVIEASDKVLSVLFGNLIRNAILYTDSGQVDITITGTSVIIQDSGRGMSDSQVKHIFDAHYRASSDTIGHGVGLSIVKRLCDRFGWKILVDSHLSQGTRIEIVFNA